MALTDIPFPEINATLNSIATLLLTLGFIFIKAGKQIAHRYAMVSAFLMSGVFLVTYVISKIVQQGVHTPFGGEGTWKLIYYIMLISHILLAIVIVPLILRTLYLAVNQQFDSHRTWARWTFPLWYYVSVTGVLVYFFLYQWFPYQGV